MELYPQSSIHTHGKEVGGGEEKDFAKPALGIMYGDGNNSYVQGFEDCALVFWATALQLKSISVQVGILVT